ncbi:response regulator transcription factor [Candidatus Dojkabacteria bacterium]|uniref:Response regulator transcription factor n=1 Tax=Candidatus Dojkabacteria bacterium TaxID=2099670 RepID=A0A955L389_9BACT|nr:response regulator transcription factor [Candidatus Dojkabacteria bacterium]
MKILVVEDTVELCDSMTSVLIDTGYTVDKAYDGKEGLSMASVNIYDLVVLDINLPSYSGFQIAKELKECEETHSVPVIAVTARYELDDKLKGFEIGFDDYITKPFEMKEFVARVDAVIRRSKPNKSVILETDDIQLDPQRRVVTRGKKEVELTKIEFNILEYLLRNKSLIVTNEQLIESVWGEDSDLLDPPIRSHIKNLRKKIGDDDFTIIKTIPGIGYKID